MAKKKEKQGFKYWSVICPFVVCTLIWVVIARTFEFYYDLNDDVLIKDIMSGIYTGTPDAHNMQMMYPISFLFTLLYKYLPAYSWMGFIEIILMWLSSVTIAGRLHVLIEQYAKRRQRWYLAVLLYVGVAVFVTGTFLWETVMLTYTVVCGVLTAAAAIYVIAGENEQFFISDNITPIVLCILAFNIRSEMFLLLCPLIAVAGLCRWMREGISRFNAKHYIGFIAIIIAGIVLTFGANRLGYKTTEWREFEEFFNARTQVYDFTGIPGYEDNKAFYDSIALEERDVKNLEDYNFVFSKISTGTLNSIADYVKRGDAITTKQPKSVGRSIVEYVKSVVRIQTPAKLAEQRDDTIIFEDTRIWSPLNIIVLILYVLVILTAILEKDKDCYIQLGLLVVMRSISWVYVISKDRVNARIAHPLYVVEICILLGMIFAKKKILPKLLAAVAIIVISAIYIPGAVKTIQDKQAIRAEEKEKIDKIYNYTCENPRYYYYLDVYDMTADSDKVFVQNDYGKGNTQLAGGWMALSPLDKYKIGFYPDDSKRFISTRDLEEFYIDERIEDEEGNVMFTVYYLTKPQ